MPLVLKDRVKVTSTSEGTGAFVLGAAADGFQDFAVIGDGNDTYYTIADGTDYEVGIGSFTASTGALSRDVVLDSSNGGSLVDFAVGDKDVFVTYPAEKSSVTFPSGSRTANYTASSNEGVLTDTSGGAFTVTLPATPLPGARVVVSDTGGAWGTNNLTVARNGSTIAGQAENIDLDINGAQVTFIFDGATWRVYAQIGGAGGDALTAADIGVTVQGFDANLATTGKAIAMAIVFGG